MARSMARWPTQAAPPVPEAAGGPRATPAAGRPLRRTFWCVGVADGELSAPLGRLLGGTIDGKMAVSGGADRARGRGRAAGDAGGRWAAAEQRWRWVGLNDEGARERASRGVCARPSMCQGGRAYCMCHVLG